jgi:hypothetical protein
MMGWGLRRELTQARIGALAWRTLIACVAMGMTAWYAATWNMVLAIVAGIVVYGGAHALLGTLSAQERMMLRQLLRR